MNVNWDDEIPNIWKNKIHVPKHQPDFNGYGGGISTMMYNATSMNHLWDEYLWDIISSDDINHFNGDSSYIANSSLVGGYTYPSEKYDFVNWDDEIPNQHGKIKVMFQSPQSSLCCLQFFTIRKPSV